MYSESDKSYHTRASQHQLIDFGHVENTHTEQTFLIHFSDKEHDMHRIVGFCPPLDHCGR
jgi:hypothetical protein